jgi:hypothetical protein
VRVMLGLCYAGRHHKRKWEVWIHSTPSILFAREVLEIDWSFFPVSLTKLNLAEMKLVIKI